MAGAVLFIFHLFNGGLNIDFVGGTAYAGQLVHPVNLTELRDRLQQPLKADAMQKLGVAADLPDSSIEQVFVNDPALTEGSKSALFTVRTSEKNAALVQKIVNYKLGAEWGKEVGDKDDPGDLLKRIVMQPPQIDEQNGRAKAAVLNFVKSTDDFTADKVGGVVDKVRTVLEKDLGVSGLKPEPVEGTAGFFTLKVTLPEGSNKKVADVKTALQKARDDLAAQGLKAVNPSASATGPARWAPLVCRRGRSRWPLRRRRHGGQFGH